MEYPFVVLVVSLVLLVTMLIFLKFFFETRNELFVFAAIGFFVLFIISTWAVVGVSMESISKGPCEFLVSNSTYISSSNTTLYNYSYTCADRISMKLIETIYTVFTVVIYALFISVCLIPIIYLVSMIKKKF